MQRIHRTQIKLADILAVETRVRGIDCVRWGFHMQQALDRAHATGADIQRVLAKGKLIEINDGNGSGEPRVVLRHDENGWGTCVVVSLVRRELVTLWVNTSHDKHFTLDRNAYRWRPDIAKLLQEV